MGSRCIGSRGMLAAAAVLVVMAGWTGWTLGADDKPNDASWQERVLALKHITGKDPMRGQLLKLLEDHDDARELLAVAVKMAKEKDQPLNYNAVYILARLAQQLKDTEKSNFFYRLCIEKAKKLHSTEQIYQGYEGLFAEAYDSQKFAEAVKLGQEFLELPFESDRVAEISREDKIDRLKRLILLQSIVQRQMIQALARQGKVQEATKMVDFLLKRNPDNWLNLQLRGWVQREAGQYEDAAKTYEDLLERVQKDKKILTEEGRAEYISELRYSLSGIYVDANQVQKAAEHLKMLLANDPNNPGYNNDLGYIWADHGMNLDESEKLIRKALDLDRKRRRAENPKAKPDEIKDNASYLDSLGWVLFKQKKYKEAKPYLEKAVKNKEEGQHIEIYDHLADVYMALGEKLSAIATWKKALELTISSNRELQRKSIVQKKLQAAQD